MTFCKHESDSRCLQRFTIEPASLRVSSFSYLSYDSPNFTLSFWASSSSVQSSVQAGIKVLPLSNLLSNLLILRLIASLSRKQIPLPTNLQTHQTISGRTPPTNLCSSSYLSNSSRASKDKQAQQRQQSIVSGTSGLLQGNFGNAPQKGFPTDSTMSTQFQESPKPSNAILSLNTKRLLLLQRLSLRQECSSLQTEERSQPTEIAIRTRLQNAQMSSGAQFCSLSYSPDYTTLRANLNLAQLFALPHRLARPPLKPASLAVGRARSVGLKPKCWVRFSWRGASLRHKEEASMEGKGTWAAGFTPATQVAGISPAQNCQGHSRLKSGACPMVR